MRAESESESRPLHVIPGVVGQSRARDTRALPAERPAPPAVAAGAASRREMVASAPALHQEAASAPSLRAVTRIPLYVGHGRRLEPGLDATGVRYDPDPTLELLPVPDAPTDDQVNAAVEFLQVELFAEVPFLGWRDFRAAVQALLAPFLRGMYSAPPRFFVSSDRPGVGKTGLTRIIASVVNGYPVAIVANPTPIALGEYLRQAAARGEGTVIIDPIRRGAQLGHCSQVIASETWAPRGEPIVNWPTWLGVVTDPIALDDPADYDIRLSGARAERAFQRRDPVVWALEHRAEVVQAVLTLIQAWVAEGARPVVRPVWESVFLD
jgi:hypothetical protein